jgi:general secretion pathway protein G
MRSQGYSFVELLIVTSILFILASVVVPLAQVTSQRQRESELRASLRQVRTAIDKFKDAVDAGRIAQAELSPGSEGYPPDLETLVEGVPIQNDQSGAKLKFTEWGLRAYQDKPDATTWGRGNVFDIHSKSSATALDGTKYKDW